MKRLAASDEIHARRLVVLRELAACRSTKHPPLPDGWARPMDVGAHSRSPHSADLAALWAVGLVERKRRGTLANVLGSGRGSWKYRITNAGIAALRAAELEA